MRSTGGILSFHLHIMFTGLYVRSTGGILSFHLHIMFTGLYVIYRGNFKLSFTYNVYRFIFDLQGEF